MDKSMKKAEKTIMWVGATAALVFSIIQMMGALVRGSWLVALLFAAMVAAAKKWMEILDAEDRKEASDDREQA